MNFIFCLFDEYNKQQRNFYIVEIINIEYFFSWKDHLKNYKCCHSITLEIVFGYVSSPLDFNLYRIHSARTVGIQSSVPSLILLDNQYSLL